MDNQFNCMFCLEISHYDYDTHWIDLIQNYIYTFIFEDVKHEKCKID